MSRLCEDAAPFLRGCPSLERVRAGRIAAAGFLVLALLTLGVSLPIVAVLSDDAIQQRQQDARDAADVLANALNSEYTRMVRARRLMLGFVASAAPLQVPQYFTTTAEERVAVATTTGTPGALSNASFQRLSQATNAMFAGFRNLLVQPGLVNAFVQPQYAQNQYMRDWLLDFNDFATKEYQWAVEHATTLVRGPLPGSMDPTTSLNMVLRVPVFNSSDGLTVGQPWARDPSTRQHPNWNYFWGAITIVMDLKQVIVAPSFLEALNKVDYEYLYDSQPNSDRVEPTPYAVVYNSTDPANYAENDAITVCSDQTGFESLCIHVYPKKGWGRAERKTALGIAAGCAILVPLVLAVAGLGIVKSLSRRTTSLYEYAPTKSPFHAVCIEMVAGSKMWAEVPYVMSELSGMFSAQVARRADECRCHIALKSGTSVVVVSRSRRDILRFTLALQHWLMTASWPPHIDVHLQRIGSRFSFVLHTVADAVVTLDPVHHLYDVAGDDFRTALLLRSVAIPGHILCTGEFLDLQSERLATFPSAKGSSQPDQQHVLRMLGGFAELGVCGVPRMKSDGSWTERLVTGYLIAGTMQPHPAANESVGAGRSIAGHLNSHSLQPSAGAGSHVAIPVHTHVPIPSVAVNPTAVVESLPDSVWVEWRPARAYLHKRAKVHSSLSPMMNPLGSIVGSNASAVGIGHAFSNSEISSHPADRAHIVRLASRSGDAAAAAQDAAPAPAVVVRRSQSSVFQGRIGQVARVPRALPSYHAQNAEAVSELPGSAVSIGDAQRLGQVMLSSHQMRLVHDFLARSPSSPASSVSNAGTPRGPVEARESGDRKPPVSRSPSQVINTPQPARGSSSACADSTTHHARLLRRTRATMSLGTYYLAAYRIIFAPLDPSLRDTMVARVCGAVGVSNDYSVFTLAARCAHVTQQFCEAEIIISHCIAPAVEVSAYVRP
jgi:hypothetical protein